MTTIPAAESRSDRPRRQSENRSPRTLHGTIDNREVVSSGSNIFERHAPADGFLASYVPSSSPSEIAGAIRSARTAFDTGRWPDMPADARAQLLRRLADLIDRDRELLAALDAEEVGAPITSVEADIALAAELCRYAAGLGMSSHGDLVTNLGPSYTGLIVRQPVGVVGLIIPWNFPLLIICQKLPFALAAGCTAVIKPSEFTSSSAVHFMSLVAEAGFPEGTVNLVLGRGDVGEALTASPEIDLVSFTGSTRTGRRVKQVAAVTNKRLHLELGGKAATIVFGDADLESAVNGIVHGATFNNGECCVAQSRLLVHESVREELLAGLAERFAALCTGDPFDRDTQVGPLIHEQHLERALSFVADAPTVLVGGKKLTGDRYSAGHFLAPTILADIEPKHASFREEIFAPVLTATTFKTAEEAVALANSVDYGLSNSVWSKNIDTALGLAQRLQSGMVFVNTSIDVQKNMPFGGVKASGVGREMGQAGFDEFTELKTIAIRTRFAV
ncbi:aldehyde dehydrogenase family protein [Microbacterium sp. X-17]|uniref:aldehyde dehydrogenase family protein n=1 Tax=Microbacterium sp. X-17 TaxID=3144404 RepID=UPI0031F57002